MIISPQVQGTYFVAFPPISRKENDGKVGLRSHLLADLQAEAFRSIKTQQQEIGPIECTWYGVFTMSSCLRVIDESRSIPMIALTHEHREM
jgi:hypothetical protein